MNIHEQLNLDNDKYGLLFDVRRSIRYHDRRRAFYERLHAVTGVFTVLMAGSVLFDIGKNGETAGWLLVLSVFAALMAALDMVIGYSKRAGLHSSLRERFANLEISMILGDTADETWLEHHKSRLLIEKDEPPIYKVLDNLCRNDLLTAEGFSPTKNPNQFVVVSRWKALTAQFWQWENDPCKTHEGELKAKVEPAKQETFPA